MQNIYNIYKQRNTDITNIGFRKDLLGHQVCVPIHFIDEQNNFIKLVQAPDFGPKFNADKHKQRNELFSLTNITRARNKIYCTIQSNNPLYSTVLEFKSAK